MGSFDLIVVGGGINGAGIARDAAIRGLKTLVLDKGDFGAGTSNASSGFIHGGARYLTTNIQTTYHSCVDSGVIQRIAPHLLFRVPFLYPVTSRWKGLLVDSFFSAYDVFSKYRNGRPHCWLSQPELHAVLPGICSDYVGAATFDEWSVKAHRLVIANLLDAMAHGAELRSYTEVVRVVVEHREGKQVATGVEVVNRLTGERATLSARLICNVTGPWSMNFAAQNKLRVPLRPAKGLHLVLPKRVTSFGVMCTAIDGRLIFFLPHGDMTIVGTTDDDSFESPDHIRPHPDEVAYLREGVAHIYPAIVRETPTMTYWGVRPTLYGRGQMEDALSRAHKIFDHEKTDGVTGIVSLAGGKLATYRVMAEETTDVICNKLGRTVTCRTAVEPLVGASPVDLQHDFPKLTQLRPGLVTQLYHRYGSEIRLIEDMLVAEPGWGRVLDEVSGLTEVELRYGVEREWVQTLGDLNRRTEWGAAQVVPDDVVHRVVRAMGEILDWDSEQFLVEANRFVEAQQVAAAPLAAWREDDR